MLVVQLLNAGLENGSPLKVAPLTATSPLPIFEIVRLREGLVVPDCTVPKLIVSGVRMICPTLPPVQ